MQSNISPSFLCLTLNNLTYKVLTLQTKNFMVKSFIFDDPVLNEEKILRFSHSLVSSSNYQSVIHTRFHNLIHDFDINSSNLNEESNTNNTQIEQMRKSYLVPIDLQQDLIESKCDNHICVKTGYAEVIPNKFIIDT